MYDKKVFTFTRGGILGNRKAPEAVADMLKIMENSSTEVSHGEKKLSQKW